MKYNYQNHLSIGDDEQMLSRADKYGSSSRKRKEEDPEQQASEIPEEESAWWSSTLFWLFRKSIAPIIMIIMLVAGLYIGYVYVGGQPKEEVFRWDTWKHMWDLIFAES